MRRDGKVRPPGLVVRRPCGCGNRDVARMARASARLAEAAAKRKAALSPGAGDT
jgi:hypothetical protein